MKATAMRRIGTNDVAGRHGKPSQSAAFGAVPMDNVDARGEHDSGHPHYGNQIRWARLPADRNSVKTERKPRLEGRKLRLRCPWCFGAVSDDSDLMPTVDLARREVNNVPKKTANRGTQHVQDFHNASPAVPIPTRARTRASRLRNLVKQAHNTGVCLIVRFNVLNATIGHTRAALNGVRVVT